MSGIESNIIIALIMISYALYSVLAEVSETKTVIYSCFLLVFKSAIPISTGVICSSKIREGIQKYFTTSVHPEVELQE